MINDYEQHFLSKNELDRILRNEEEDGGLLMYQDRNLLHKDHWARTISRMTDLNAPPNLIEIARRNMNFSLAEYNEYLLNYEDKHETNG